MLERETNVALGAECLASHGLMYGPPSLKLVSWCRRNDLRSGAERTLSSEFYFKGSVCCFFFCFFFSVHFSQWAYGEF